MRKKAERKDMQMCDGLRYSTARNIGVPVECANKKEMK